MVMANRKIKRKIGNRNIAISARIPSILLQVRSGRLSVESTAVPYESTAGTTPFFGSWPACGSSTTPELPRFLYEKSFRPCSFMVATLKQCPGLQRSKRRSGNRSWCGCRRWDRCQRGAWSRCQSGAWNRRGCRHRCRVFIIPARRSFLVHPGRYIRVSSEQGEERGFC